MVGVLCAVLIVAVGNAVQYFVQVFVMADKQRILTGTFLNRNHFGFLMTMGIMATSGLLAIVNSKSRGPRYDHQNRSLDYEYPQALVFILTFVLLFLIVAQALCLSRGAFLTSTIGLMTFWGTWAYRQQKHHHHSQGSFLNRHQLAVPAILLAGALCVALPWVLEALSERYAELLTLDGLDSVGRLRVWKISLGVLKDYWLQGTGLGSYGVAAQPLEQGFFPRALIVHAHNDFLELGCEQGLPMMLFLVAVGLRLWLRSFHVIRRQHDAIYHWAGMCALVAIASCTAHEFVEFSMKAWPNAFCFTALLAVAAACDQKQRRRGSGSLQKVVPMPAVGGASTIEVTDAEAIFEDPEEAEKKLRSDARHHRHELLRKNRWRFRLVYLAIALVLLSIGCPLLLTTLIGGLHATRLQVAQEEMRRDQGKYIGRSTLADYTRMHALAGKALAHWTSFRPKMLSKRAGLSLRMAWMMEQNATQTAYGQRAVTKFDSNELRHQCLADLAAACQRLPGSGEYTFQYARTLERMMELGVIEMSWEDLLKIYEWALSCQPGVVVSVREVADKYARAWIWALQNHSEDAAAYRQRAIDGYLHSLDLQDSNLVLNALRKLRVPLDEILTHISPGEPQLRFFNSLLTVQDYATAERVLKVLAEAKPEEKTISPMEWHLKVCRAKCRLAELTGNVDQCASFWQEMYQAADVLQAQRLTEYESFLAANDRWSAEQLLKKLTDNPLANSQVVLERARQLYYTRNHPEEVVLALMPLVYGMGEPVPESLAAALELLESVAPAISINSPMNFRKTFLEEALIVRMHSSAQSVNQGEREVLAAAVQRLEELNATPVAFGSSRWIQEHLVPYYAGLGQEILGNVDQAVVDYRQSLKLCPNFLWGIVRLAQLRPEELNDSEQQLLQWQRRLANPIGFLSKGLLWLDLETTPQILTELHDTAQCTFALLCTDDFYSSNEWWAVFRDRRGVVFRKKLVKKRMAGKLLTTRVGELLLITIPVQPVVVASKNVYRSLLNGALNISIGSCSTRGPILQLQK